MLRNATSITSNLGSHGKGNLQESFIDKKTPTISIRGFRLRIATLYHSSNLGSHGKGNLQESFIDKKLL